MANVAGKAYAMNVLTPMRPSRTWINRLIFMASRGLPANLGGLLGLSLIHFARWVIVKRDAWPNPENPQARQPVENDYMVFCSNFNGTWDQYIDAFSDGIPSGLDLFWYSSTKYPNSIPITPFKDYITHNQFDTDYYYNATPGSAQRDIKCALKVYKALLDLEKKHKSLSAEEFAQAYSNALAGSPPSKKSHESEPADPGKPGIQGCLGAPGFGPVASLDTEHADENRKKFVRRIWK